MGVVGEWTPLIWFGIVVTALVTSTRLTYQYVKSGDWYPASEMTYIVSRGALNSTHSLGDW